MRIYDIEFDIDCYLSELATEKRSREKCRVCNGNDDDMPCAFPGEGQPGCVRGGRLSRIDEGANRS